MIRINLLPVRAAKKKESVRFQLTVAGLITFAVFVVTIGVYVRFSAEASALRDDITKGKLEIEELKLKIGELSKIKEQKKIVEEKLNVIKKLETGRTGPTDFFNMLGDSIPEKLWLMSFSETGVVVTLKGYAVDEETVADFMRGLQRHSELGRVELETIQKAKDKDSGVDVVEYEIKLEKGR
ncbi:MAG: PilN domain-containing protein [Deltaproteobacteria bacterium]|nr:PilN domain-containing protein [Deltaproteobacteria bacterium]